MEYECTRILTRLVDQMVTENLGESVIPKDFGSGTPIFSLLFYRNTETRAYKSGTAYTVEKVQLDLSAESRPWSNLIVPNIEMDFNDLPKRINQRVTVKINHPKITTPFNLLPHLTCAEMSSTVSSRSPLRFFNNYRLLHEGQVLQSKKTLT